MVIYIEYALAENFLIDSLLLYLALSSARKRVRWRRLCFAATVGAAFAVVFPLFPLPMPLSYALKFLFALPLCLLAFGRIKGKEERGRYALTCVFFFAYSFALAGALFALSNGFFANGSGYVIPRANVLFVLIGSAAFVCFVVAFIKKLWARRAVERLTYPCSIVYKQRRVETLGFFDSGNLATKNGVPVCFLSPDIAYDLRENELWERGERTEEGIVVATMSGERYLPVFRGSVEIEANGKRLKKEVYFAPSTNMLSRGYKILLHSRIFEENG